MRVSKPRHVHGHGRADAPGRGKTSTEAIHVAATTAAYSYTVRRSRTRVMSMERWRKPGRKTSTLSKTTVVLVIWIKGRDVGEKKVCTTSGASSATWIRNTADLERVSVLAPVGMDLWTYKGLRGTPWDIVAVESSATT